MAETNLIVFEDQYSPRKLGNWEYPKWYPERPRQRLKPTKIIADDNGCLLEGVRGENPWGNYVGTWDLPRRITREYVKKLVAPPERLIKRWGKKKKDVEVSEVEKQEIKKSEIKKPEAEEPEVKEPEAKEPEVEKPEIEKPEVEKPEAEKKEAEKKVVEKKEEPKTPPAEKEKERDYLPNIDSNPSAEKNFQKRNKSSSALDLRPRSTKLQSLVSLQRKSDRSHDIKPGTLDEKIKHILDSVQEEEDKSVPAPPEAICKEIKAVTSSRREVYGFEQRGDEKENYGFLNYLDKRKLGKSSADWGEKKQSEIDLEFVKEEEEKSSMEKYVNTSDRKPLEPLKNGFLSFQVAKRFHDENLRHKPLPDVIDDPVFKALNSGKQTNPGGALDVNPLPSAVGWKPYSAPRPTECSKLKVFRPKTGTEKQQPVKDLRPKTGYKKRFLPIDLAICWDLKPEDPSDEPKRSPHIDGSNGSVAPAVFTMIYPTEPEDLDQNIPGSAQAVVQRITKGIDAENAATLPSHMNGKIQSPIASNKEAILSCVKSCRESSPKQGTPGSLNSMSPNAAEYARRHPKTAWTKEDTSKALSERLRYLQKENEKNGPKDSCLSRSSSESSQTTKKKHHQSTPNLATVCDGSHCGTEKSTSVSLKGNGTYSKNSGSETAISGENKFGTLTVGKNSCEKNSKNGLKKRNCSACKKSSSDCNEIRQKTEFKSAFKAGVPRSESTNSGSSSAAKSYKVPKMRLPYAKRSYSIGTLAPPFSLWRENNGKDYPEHWRLASVYQHSYKPINFRKRPLLASVYQ